MHGSLRRPLRLSWLVAAFALAACASAEGGTAADAVVDVPTTAVKNQAGGNCPLYAFSSWSESLAKGATGRELDVSETYLTYMMWRNLLVEDRLEDGGKWVAEGAWFMNEIFDLVERYGLVREASFVPGEERDGYPHREAGARKRIENALKAGGDLATVEQRRDKRNVRRVLDEAFGLTAEMRDAMTRVFGEVLDGTLRDRREESLPAGFLAPGDITVGYVDGDRERPVTLADALGKPGERTRRDNQPYVFRAGTFAWNDSIFPSRERDGRELVRRMKATLNAGFGVVMGWYAMDASVNLADGSYRGRGRIRNDDAGHFSLIADYQIDVPGLGTLRVGERASPVELAATLDDAAAITFVRTKNSWGLRRGPGPVGPGGFNDVYWGEYLMLDAPTGGLRLSSLTLPPEAWRRVKRRPL